jgi:polar amino acid transport system permease protein
MIEALSGLFPPVIIERLPMFVDGAKMTFELTLVAGSLGLFLGLLLAVMKDSDISFLRAPADFFIWIIRGTPLLVQILFAYNALPQLLPFLKLEEFSAAVLALTLNIGAYNAEVFRGGFSSVPRGQREAAKSLGLSKWTTFSIVVLPQAMRVSIPALVNNLVALLKDSSLASSISLLELSHVGSRISSETFQPVPVLGTVALFYLILTTLITMATSYFEKKYMKIYGIKKATSA